MTGSLWEGAALTGAVVPLPGHREHLNRKEPDMVISGLLTHTFSQSKMQSYFRLHILFPSKTVCQSTLIPATAPPQSCLDSPSSQLWSASNPIQATDKRPSDFTLPAWYPFSRSRDHQSDCCRGFTQEPKFPSNP